MNQGYANALRRTQPLLIVMLVHGTSSTASGATYAKSHRIKIISIYDCGGGPAGCVDRRQKSIEAIPNYYLTAETAA